MRKVKKTKMDDSLPIKEFDVLFNELYPIMVIFAHKYIINIHECECIVQDVFVNYWHKVHNSEKTKIDQKAYLYRSVYNKCIDKIRHNSVEQKRMTGYIYGQDQHTNIKDFIAESELKVRIEKAINKLPTQCKRIFLMSRDEELTYKQIADELNISVKTVETQIGKALKILRKQLSKFIITLLHFF